MVHERMRNFLNYSSVIRFFKAICLHCVFNFCIGHGQPL